MLNLDSFKKKKKGPELITSFLSSHFVSKMVLLEMGFYFKSLIF